MSPWIAAEYYRDTRSAQSFEDGWLRTGDVCKITPEGYIKITDRAKDVIKSGGEWISSIDLENALMAHPDVSEATVVLREDVEVSEEDLHAFLEERVAKWWLPDKILFIEQIPKTGTGKFDKKVVRNEYADLLMEDG